MDYAKLREGIEKAGGLVTVGELASEWDVSVSRAYQIAALHDFPSPVRAGLYFRGEAHEYRRNHPTSAGGRPTHRATEPR